MNDQAAMKKSLSVPGKAQYGRSLPMVNGPVRTIGSIWSVNGSCNVDTGTATVVFLVEILAHVCHLLNKFFISKRCFNGPTLGSIGIFSHSFQTENLQKIMHASVGFKF